jgi:membrane associated rhomboid family serine protease
MSASDLSPPLPVRPRSLGETIKSNSALLFGPLAIMWALQIINTLPFMHLEQYGIQPRTLRGLFGILLAPLLHGGFPHLIANTVPFVMLGALVLLGGRAMFWGVTIIVVLFGGFGVWLLAPAYTVHIGASGLIFGYLGFLLTRGYVERSVRWILAAVAILVAYGSMLWGMLPGQMGISWQSHLFGFFAGIFAAWLLVKRPDK